MFSMKIHGGEELSRRLDALPQAFSRRVLLAALRAGGEPMRVAVAQKAPREPGAPDLADNINIAAVRKREGEPPTVAIGPASKFFFYDLFQERGTVRHRAQPFYRPAFDTKAPEALGIVGQELWKALRAQLPAERNLGSIGGRFA